MSSIAQIEANRANAKNSTGPQSSEGKSAVARNAVTHGLASRNIFLPGENPEDWFRLRDQLRASFRIEGSNEDPFLDDATHASWKLQRIETWQTMLIEAAFAVEPVPQPIALLFGCDHETAMKRLQRYEGTTRGALNRALSHLRAIAAERARERAQAQAAESAAQQPATARQSRNRTNPIAAPQTAGPDAASSPEPPIDPTSGS